jgi:hypothetical protein
LKPRPNAQPWDEYNIHYGPNIAGALGLPDAGCEFGACNGGISGFQQQQTGNPNIWQPSKFDLTLELLGLHIPFHDLSDPNHRLFGTHYCGPGGGGNSTGGVDDLCYAHDTCLDRFHLTWEDETKKLPADQAANLQQCNQTLCDSAAKLGGPSATTIRLFFKGYGNYTCH